MRAPYIDEGFFFALASVAGLLLLAALAAFILIRAAQFVWQRSRDPDFTAPYPSPWLLVWLILGVALIVAGRMDPFAP